MVRAGATGDSTYIIGVYYFQTTLCDEKDFQYVEMKKVCQPAD